MTTNKTTETQGQETEATTAIVGLEPGQELGNGFHVKADRKRAAAETLNKKGGKGQPKSASATPTPAATPAPAPERAQDDWAAAIDAAADGPTVMADIRRAEDTLNSDKRVGVFVGATEAADALARLNLKGEDEMDDWFACNLTQVKVHLTNWGDHASLNILSKLKLFDGSPASITEQLWTYVVEVSRPAKNVTKFPELEGFLNRLAEKKWIDSEGNKPPRRNRDMIELRSSNSRNFVRYYSIEGQRSMAGLAWNVAKETTDRARAQAKEYTEERGGRFEELKNEDTGLTASEAREGKQGKVFFIIDRMRYRGVLMAVEPSRRGMGPAARILNAVGIRLNNRPEWIGLDAPIGEWDSPEVFRAVQAWKKASIPPTPPPPTASQTPDPTQPAADKPAE